MVKTKTRNPKTDGETIDLEQELEDEPDMMALRIVETKDRSFKVVQHNPYALWKIKPDHGPLPEALSGLYTSINDAEFAIERYVKN